MSLKELSYIELPPHPSLEKYIKSYWFLHCRTESVQPFDIMPDGYFDLIISLKDGVIVNVRLVGVWNKMIRVEYTNLDSIGVRFTPQALPVLLNTSVRELLNTYSTVDLAEWNLEKQILEDLWNSDFRMIMSYFDKCFASRLKDRFIDKRLDSLFNLVEFHQGQILVNTLSKEVGLSARQIQRKTNEFIGIGLKEYSNIVRFNKVLSLIKEDKSNYLGYFDQSHFIKSFRSYTGLLPSEVDLKNDVRFLQYFDFSED